MADFGLMYYGARWYDSALSRFAQADTLIPQQGDSQAWDRYAYALNNSLRYVDPTGHMSSSAIHDSDGDAQCNNPVHCLDKRGRHKVNIPSVPKGQKQKDNGSTDLEGVEQSGEPDNALLWGANFSGSNQPNYWTGGIEEIWMWKNKTRATYKYGGQGNTLGGGASVTAYGGMVFNVENPEDYRENSAAVGITVSILEKGVSISYFWNTNEPPLTPGNVQGFTIGYAPGAQVSIWNAITYYEVWEIIR